MVVVVRTLVSKVNSHFLVYAPVPRGGWKGEGDSCGVRQDRRNENSQPRPNRFAPPEGPALFLALRPEVNHFSKGAAARLPPLSVEAARFRFELFAGGAAHNRDMDEGQEFGVGSTGNGAHRFSDLLSSGGAMVAEGAVVERLRRDRSAPPLDPLLSNALHPFSESGRSALIALWNAYLDAILPSRLPALLLAPTWRASAHRAARAGWGVGRLNGEAVRLVAGVRSGRGEASAPIFVGGLMGCAGDAYRPAEGLSEAEAFRYHQPQADALAAAGADFLLASTLPALPEAVGLARAMASTGLDALVGFVVRPNGALLDRTPLGRAIEAIDEASERQGRAPAGFLATCTTPTRCNRRSLRTQLARVRGGGSSESRGTVRDFRPRSSTAAGNSTRPNRRSSPGRCSSCGTDSACASLAVAAGRTRGTSPPWLLPWPPASRAVADTPDFAPFNSAVSPLIRPFSGRVE